MGARRILYLDVELADLETRRDLVAALRSYLDAERSPVEVPGERLAIFLDEVTRVSQWAGAIRGLVDNDELAGATVVATGSHTRDLQEGGERLPGRRGGGGELDLELLPLGFREFVALVEPELRLPPPMEPDWSPSVQAGLDRAVVRPRFRALLDRYLATGGFLAALNDQAVHGSARAETFQLFRESIAGEFTCAGMREGYLKEIINWLADHLG